MNKTTETINKTMANLKQKKDETRLQAHLGIAEAKDTVSSVISAADRRVTHVTRTTRRELKALPQGIDDRKQEITEALAQMKLDVEQLRDRLRVQAHLGSKEAKDDLEKLETKWAEVIRKYIDMSTRVQHKAEDAREALSKEMEKLEIKSNELSTKYKAASAEASTMKTNVGAATKVAVGEIKSGIARIRRAAG